MLLISHQVAIRRCDFTLYEKFEEACPLFNRLKDGFFKNYFITIFVVLGVKNDFLKVAVHTIYFTSACKLSPFERIHSIFYSEAREYQFLNSDLVLRIS